MKVSLIVNTAAGAAHAATTKNPWRSGSYSDRGKLLDEIISTSGDFDEVIVAGSYVAGNGYTYLNVQPVYADRRDALYQREMGARFSTGDILCFTHDDHLPRFSPKDIAAVGGDWDILVPKRIHGKTGATLSNGHSEGYMGGHTLLMKREVWVSVPWLSVESARCWDLVMTDLWRELEYDIVFTNDLISVDLEAQENEG